MTDTPPPPPVPQTPCPACAGEHTAGHHDAEPESGYHDGAPPIRYATEPVMVDDDDD